MPKLTVVWMDGHAEDFVASHRVAEGLLILSKFVERSGREEVFAVIPHHNVRKVTLRP